MKKIIAGIITILLGLGIEVWAIVEIARNLPKTGALTGSILGYRPPYPYHGLYVVIAIGLGLLLFLVGLVITSVGAKERR